MLRLCALLIIISLGAMIAFIYLFTTHNMPGFSSSTVITAIAGGYTVLFALSSLNAAGNCLFGVRGTTGMHTKLLPRLLLLAAAITLWCVFIDAAILDYYQPVSLFDNVIAALAVSWGSLSIALIMMMAVAKRAPRQALHGCLILASVALLGWPLAGSLAVVNNPQPSPLLSIHKDVFSGGKDGYKTYRIPGLLVVPGGTTLADGTTLPKDQLLAFAEARRDSALDTGVIDLVLKHSDDGGSSWSEQRVVCRHEAGVTRGKCGNATPLLDAVTGTIHLAYNTSTSGEFGPRHHASMIMQSRDGGISWSQPRQLADDNLVFGPGHGIQKLLAPHRGRLLLPGYLEDHAIVLYSDDAGATWQRGMPLDTGNETELAELSDGTLYLATRHRAPIGHPPEPNGRLYSRSNNGGENWSPAALDTQLSTPVCQASVVRYMDGGGLLFSNPDHRRSRVNMSIHYSPDDGVLWSHDISIYPGPAGYSQLGVAGDGDVLLLYERGNMAYSEKISFARLPADQLL